MFQVSRFKIKQMMVQKYQNVLQKKNIITKALKVLKASNFKPI
jgi:hypothetical protein